MACGSDKQYFSTFLSKSVRPSRACQRRCACAGLGGSWHPAALTSPPAACSGAAHALLTWAGAWEYLQPFRNHFFETQGIWRVLCNGNRWAPPPGRPSGLCHPQAEVH